MTSLSPNIRFIIAPDGQSATCLCVDVFAADHLKEMLEQLGIRASTEESDLEVVVLPGDFTTLRHYGYSVEETKRYKPTKPSQGRE